MIAEIFISFFSILLIFHIYTRYSRRGRLLDRFLGPIPFPIIGNLLLFDVNTSYELWRVLRRYVKNYYPISRFWGFYEAVVNVHHPDDLEILLSCQKDIGKNYFYNYLRSWIGSGLLTTTGEKWMDRRKLLAPAFHSKVIDTFIEIINDQSKHFVEAIEYNNKGLRINIVPLCSDFALNIIIESTVGIPLTKFTSSTSNQYRKAISQMKNILAYRLVKPYVYEWMVFFVPKIKTIEKSSRLILGYFSEEVVNERRHYHAETGYKYLNDNLEADKKHEKETKIQADEDFKRRFAAIDLLLKAEKDGLIDNVGILEEVSTMIFAGHEPIATSMVLTLLLFAENRLVQDKARSEVNRIFNKKNGNVGMKEIQELNYLERCIKESMRLYPPVPTLLRFTPEELQLKNGLVPANTHMMVHLWDTHRDPNFWPDPDKFDPDRFLPEKSINHHPFAYVPFSVEPRKCIGEKLAMMELKLLIGRTLYNFYVEPIDRIDTLKFAADIVLHPKEPVRLKFTKIQRQKKIYGEENV